MAEHLAEGDGVDEHVGGILRRGPACLQGGVPGMSDGHRSLWLRTVPVVTMTLTGPVKLF